MMYIIPEQSFVSFEYNGGDVNYPDVIDYFFNTDIIEDANGQQHVVGDYRGNEVLTNSLTYDEYFDIQCRPLLVEAKTAAIKARQKELLDALEGTPENPGLWQRKAVEEITIKDSFERYDRLMDKKGYVINHGNAEEAGLQVMPPDELISYQIEFNLDEAPKLKVRRITVGAFFARFTPEESNRFDIAKSADPQMRYMFDSLSTRTHVHLDNEMIQNALVLMEATELLDPTPTSDEFASRREEVLRDGTDDERYRVISQI